MSNLHLPERYDERLLRLALGLEPIDAVRRLRIGFPIRVGFDDAPLGPTRPTLLRHGSGLFVLLHAEGLPTTLGFRLFDAGEPGEPPRYRSDTNRRRFVPRRFRVTIPAESAADGVALERRARRPALFPGAAYDTSEAVTGMRGRVTSAGKPARWARVEARLPGTATRVGRAHCDDRGEFLLLVEPAAAPLADLAEPLQLDLLAYRPDPPSPMPDAEARAADELWDLPVEGLSASGAPDPVAEGAFPPAGWTAAAAPVRTTLSYGLLRRGLPALEV